MKFPHAIQNLINQFTKLPTVGPKTAERYVFYLLKQNPRDIENLANDLINLKDNITTCHNCQATAISSPCSICGDLNRKKDILCIVSSTRDMYAIEESKQYNGYYHVLNGNMDTINNSGLGKVNLDNLINKTKTGEIKEILLALNPDLAGETTCIYLIKILKEYNVTITRLAKGLPTGANIEYADETTIANALKFRNTLN